MEPERRPELVYEEPEPLYVEEFDGTEPVCDCADWPDCEHKKSVQDDR